MLSQKFRYVEMSIKLKVFFFWIFKSNVEIFFYQKFIRKNILKYRAIQLTKNLIVRVEILKFREQRLQLYVKIFLKFCVQMRVHYDEILAIKKRWIWKRNAMQIQRRKKLNSLMSKSTSKSKLSIFNIKSKIVNNKFTNEKKCDEIIK